MKDGQHRYFRFNGQPFPGVEGFEITEDDGSGPCGGEAVKLLLKRDDFRLDQRYLSRKTAPRRVFGPGQSHRKQQSRGGPGPCPRQREGVDPLRGRRIDRHT